MVWIDIILGCDMYDAEYEPSTNAADDEKDGYTAE